jgi:hypothetical protein
VQLKYEFPRTIQGVTFTTKVETRVKHYEVKKYEEKAAAK